MANGTTQRVVEVVLQLVDRTARGARRFITNSQNISRGIDRSRQAATRAQGVFARLGQSFQRLGGQAGQMGDRLEQIGNQASQLAGSLARIAAIPALFSVGAVKSAADFSTSIGEISTLVDSAITPTAELRDTVRELSNEFGQSRTNVAQGLYQAISAGAKQGAEANEFLRVAIKAAIGGVTDIQTAVDGLTTTINSFGLSMQDADRVSDSFFTAVRGGKTTFEELSGFVFQAAPLASALGVSFEELLAALTALTKQGVPTRVAFTQIRSALQALLRQEPVNDLFREMGFESAEAALRVNGLKGTLDLINEATGGSNAKLVELIGTIEGVQGIIGLTGETGKFFTQALEEQANSAGAADTAFGKVDKTLGQQLQRTIVSASNAIESFGNALKPIVGPILRAAESGFTALNNVMEEFSTTSTVIATIIAAVGALGATFAGLAGAIGLVAAPLGKGLQLLGAWTTAAGTASTANITLAGTATTAATAVSALRTALTFLLRTLTGLVGLTAFAVFTGLSIAVNKVNDDIARIAKNMQNIRKELETFDDVQQQLVTLGVNADTANKQFEILRASTFKAVQELNRLREERKRLEEEGDSTAGVEAQIEENERVIQSNRERAQQTLSTFKGLQEELGKQVRRREEAEQQLALQTEQAKIQSSIRTREAQQQTLKEEITNLQTQVKEREQVIQQSEERIKQIRQETADFTRSIEEEIRDIRRAQLPEAQQQESIEEDVVSRLNQLRQQASRFESQAQVEQAQRERDAIRAQTQLLQNDQRRIELLERLKTTNIELGQSAEQLNQRQLDEANTSLQELNSQIDLGKQTIQDFADEVEKLKGDLAAVGEEVIDPQVTITQASSAIDSLRRQIEQLKREAIIPVSVQTQQQGGVTRQQGGPVPMARGGEPSGKIPGYGGGDKVDVLAERGEYIVNKNRTSHFRGLLDAINFGSSSDIRDIINQLGKATFQHGGSTGLTTPRPLAFQAGGSVPAATERVAVDLNIGGQAFELEGDREQVTKLVRTLKGISTGLGGG